MASGWALRYHAGCLLLPLPSFARHGNEREGDRHLCRSPSWCGRSLQLLDQEVNLHLALAISTLPLADPLGFVTGVALLRSADGHEFSSTCPENSGWRYLPFKRLLRRMPIDVGTE